MNQTYVVKNGDTLWGISNQFGVSVTELARLNGVTADTLRVGQVLIIPGSSGINPSNMFVYTVKRGDSLYSIAKKYNTTVKAIIDINNLTSTSLSIGQQLRIPEQYSEGEMNLPEFTNYSVKRGDSLYSIARSFNTSVDQIIADNSLSSNVLNVGQVLKIRTTPKDTTTVLECFGEEYVPATGDGIDYITYTVVKGDSLYSIARKYNTSVSEIVKLNNLGNNNLSIGQVLKIPSSSSDTLYTVKRGDSLYSISKAFNTTVDNIKRKNNLTSNTLSIGQILKI